MLRTRQTLRADKKSNITGYVPPSPPSPPSHGQIYYYNRPLTAQNGPVQLQIGFLQRFASSKISENKKVYLRSTFQMALFRQNEKIFFPFFSRKCDVVVHIPFKSPVFIQSFYHNIQIPRNFHMVDGCPH